MSRRGVVFAIVLLALGVRGLQAVLVPALPADAIEYQNVADNLRAGRGFVLDVKPYHAYDGPVVQYSGYVRPPGLPVLLATLQTALPRPLVSTWIGPVLYVLALILVIDWLTFVGLRREAPWVGAMLAVQPGLIDVSVRPLTEPATIFFVTLALWGHARMRSPAVAGLASAAAFLVRPTGAVVGIVIGLVHLAAAVRSGAWRALLVFAALAATGPALLVAINLAGGAPALLTAQSFLTRVTDWHDGIRFMHRGGSYPSTAALVADRGVGWLLRAVLGNAVAYAKVTLGTTPGVGYLIPLAPFAVFGAREERAATGLGLLVAVGALDLGLYCLVWSTNDVYRFPALFYFATVVGVGAFAARGLHVVADRIGGRAASLAAAALGTVVALWCIDAAMESTHAVAGRGVSHDDSSDLARLAALEETASAGRALLAALGPGPRASSPIVASNEAWIALHSFDRAAVLVPYDLDADEWLPFVEARGAAAVLLHVHSWPRAYREGLDAFRSALRGAGWRRTLAEGEMELWLRAARVPVPGVG